MGDQAGHKPGSGERNLLIRVTVLTALLSILLHVVWIRPLRTELDSLERQERDLKSVLSQKQENDGELNQSIQSLSRARTRWDRLQRVWTRRESRAVMAQIQQLARSSDLQIKSFVPLERVESRFYQEYPLQISLEGNFHNLGHFLEKVGQCEEIINVSNLAIRRVNGDPLPGTSLQAKMTASTFVLKDSGSDPEKEAD